MTIVRRFLLCLQKAPTDCSCTFHGIRSKDGGIKLFGKNNTQAILQSTEPVPSKFLKFIQNQGILMNVTLNNHKVWDIDKKHLSDEYVVQKGITYFSVIQHSFLHVGTLEILLAIFWLIGHWFKHFNEELPRVDKEKIQVQDPP